MKKTEAVDFRDAVAAHNRGHEEAIKKQLFRDQATYVKKEQRRLEILISHWNILVHDVDRDTKQAVARTSDARRI